MNYANMIEEKHLKKGFIIATLISTVIGTFTTSIGLYERVRDRHRQHKTDHSQDEKIKDLERRADASDRARRQAEKEKHEHAMAQLSHKNNNNNDNNNNGNNGYPYPYPPYQYPPLPPPYGRPQNDLRDALAASGPMIRREYDRDYARLGSRFAEGDKITENELQAQIIDLQASVIGLLQDALETGVLPDPAVLYAAAGRARNGSIRALQDQYQRMLAAAPMQREIGGGYGPGGGGRRALRASSVASGSTRNGGDDYAARRRSGRDWVALDRDRERDRDRDRDRDWDRESDRDRGLDRGRRSQSQAGARRAATFPLEQPQRPPLFCRYAVELQQDWRRPLDVGSDGDGNNRRNSRNYDDDESEDGDLICPACMGQFAIEHDRSWKMHKPVVVGERVEEIVNRDSKPGSGDGDGDSSRESRRGGPIGDDNNDDDAEGKLVTSRRRNIIELVQDRQFVLSNRFIVKCHRPAAYEAVDGYDFPGGGGGGGGMLLPPTFACCLCDRFDSSGGGKVAVCTTMTRLVNHVCEQHTVGELLSDPDIRELRPRR